MTEEIDSKAENRAVAASKQARIGEGGGKVGKSLERAILSLGYPVSANRYWRTCRGRTFRSAEADDYKAAAKLEACRAGVVCTHGPVEIGITLHPKLTKMGLASLLRMDLDNCIKVTLDALNGVAYVDDAQVVKLIAEVGEAKPGGGLTVVVGATERCA